MMVLFLLMMMGLAMDKCREEFEDFCKLNLFVNLDVDGDGNFTSRETKDKFILWHLAWKASRESMKAIKLPNDLTLIDCDYDNGYLDAIERCKAAITSAGYKVEE